MMKKAAFAPCLVLLLACAASLPATVPAAPSAPTAGTRPESNVTTAPDNTKYLNRPELLPPCAARVAAFKGKSCRIIFIGDSITAGWLTRGKAVWDKYYARRDALDFGTGGHRIQNVLWRLENMDIRDLRPKVAVILIGTNNLSNSPQEIADGVKVLLAKTQQVFPGIKIILVSIMPNQRANQKMMDADELIRVLPDGDTVEYLDLVPFMPALGSNWVGLGPDHLHPDARGYEIWATVMEPILRHQLQDFDGN
jgi:lysophospholipase L1-like esterase